MSLFILHGEGIGGIRAERTRQTREGREPFLLGGPCSAPSYLYTPEHFLHLIEEVVVDGTTRI